MGCIGSRGSLNGVPLRNDKWQEEKVVLLYAEISVLCGRVTAHTMLDDLERGAFSLSKPLPTGSLVKVQRQLRKSMKVHIKSWEFISVMAKCSRVNCALLGYYAANSGNFLPTFRNNISVPSSRVKNFFMFFTPSLLKIGPIGFPKTSVRNYHYSLCNSPEGRRSHLLRGESLKSRVTMWFSLSNQRHTGPIRMDGTAAKTTKWIQTDSKISPISSFVPTKKRASTLMTHPTSLVAVTCLNRFPGRLFSSDPGHHVLRTRNLVINSRRATRKPCISDQDAYSETESAV